MARLVIVSNRVPDPSETSGPRAGGLVVALGEALTPGTLWFGWSGKTARHTSTFAHTVESGGLTYATIDLGEADYKAFYLGFSNGTLWPLFHMMPGHAIFDRGDYASYREVNQAFAATLLPLLKPDDLIWIHDYQLLGVAAALRGAGVTNRIGFFLHIPFPAPALFELLPPATALLEAMLAHDVIGFQTEYDRAHFLGALSSRLGLVASNGVISHRRRHVTCVVTPVGIDADAFTAMASNIARRIDARRVIESLAGRALMIGVDRLDYTKGLPERFDAYRRFLQDYPEHRRHISFLQIAAPSREEVDRYRELREDLNHKAGSINGAYSDFDWVPLRYMTRTAARSMVAGLYRIARIGLVTPLRDGMNLVAKEYVAAQNPEDPGVLILSRFAGAAKGMPEALLVNPFDVDAVAEAISTALTMELEERQARHAALMTRVREISAANYCRGFTAWLTGGVVRQPPPKVLNTLI
jgi:trehalose 6-phosphate synthase